MNPSSLLLVGLSRERRNGVTNVAQSLFPRAEIHEVTSLSEALQHTPTNREELLILAGADSTAIASALAAVDRAGLPRWGVVVFGRSADDARVTAIEQSAEENPPSVAQALRSAAREHALRRENARLHGDLSTLGRRISHDLRTPLTAIYTACEAINESLGDEAGDHTVFTQSISTSTNELALLIERVSALLKASADPVRLEDVAMQGVVFDTLQRLESAALRKNATITQPKTWPKVRGVTTWLEIIWFNLVSNALHHISGTPQIELGWSEADGQFTFWVDDRGGGVMPGKVGKLFHPFHELHRLNAPRGLGLPLIQRLIELQGGTCGYTARPGGGSHFYFTLPATTPA